MLGNFVYSNPTTLYFGEEAKKNLAEALKGFGKRVLLTYGGGSIKRNGIYDDVVSVLKDAGKEIVELSGVMPNPTLEKVQEGSEIVRANNIDLILAVGGGSTVDYAKAVSVTAGYDGDAWQRYWVEQADLEPSQKLTPIGVVLTMAGTGSEMNGGSVITNHDKKLKIGRGFPDEVSPRFAVMNPRYTFTVPQRQMVAGIFDTMSHIMEQYFSGDDDSTSDYIAEGLMRSLIHSSRVAIKNPEDYEARSNIMWTATWGISSIVGSGKPQDWEVHMIGHAIGAYTNATHGFTLSAVSPTYYRHMTYNETKRFARFAQVVWGINPDGKTEKQLALEGIDALASWIDEIGAANNLSSLGVTEDMFDGIADATIIAGNGYKRLDRDELISILRESM
ncbi:MAG: iron-containing alcohol dehydrogenase [Bacteroides sp.]|nr:iron-containing alcohol dehydrogenase [Bacteroides sp.]